MGRIQSSVGLITGIPITETVDKLIAVSAQPRDQLKTRLAGLQQQQLAIGELSALTIAIQLSARKLASPTLFQQAKASSSQENLLTATVSGTPAAGTYQVTPVRTALSHQLISGSVSRLDQALGGGTLTARFGGFTDRGMDLDLLNSGAGVERGKIRITDRSGASATIDLRFALTIDDVLRQINNNDQINVTAVADGDAIGLIDLTGQSASNLKVQEVNGGATAADLGLGGIDVAASQAQGSRLVQLYDALDIAQLNDRTGLSIRDELDDLEVHFRDGSVPLRINLNRADIATVGDLLAALNAADPARLRAELGADGNRLVLTDLTADAGGTFAVSSAAGGTLAEDLGLAAPATAGVLTGQRLWGDLNSPLLRSLRGGQGLDSLGQMTLTDRSGRTATVNLATAETLGDALRAINQAGIGITASVNPARHGVLLQDTTGATGSNLIVADADATQTATRLGLAFDGASPTVNSGSLDLQTFHEGMSLSSLRNGEGVRLGSFTIVDTNGKTSGVNLRTSGAKTVGDVIDLINGLGLAVAARINDTGDGLLLVDTAHGGGTLAVVDVGAGRSAADLRLAGAATTIDVGGTPTQAIDGTTTVRLTFGADDTLSDVVDAINNAQQEFKASIFQSGSGTNPYRLVLSSETPGAVGAMLVDASALGLSFRELAPAQDALVMLGGSDLPGAGVLASSSTNRFTNVIDGLRLTVVGGAESPVSIDVRTTDEGVVSNVKLLVDQYNKLREKINSLTFFDAQSEATGVLFGSREVLQVESQLSRLFSGRILGLGSVQSLEQLGISFTQEGKLTLDETKLKEAFAADPEGVQAFFTDQNTGFAKKVDAAVESLAGVDRSVLMTRNNVLQRTIEEQNARLVSFNTRLDRERERLLVYFYNLELAISKMKANLSVVEALAPMPLMIGRNTTTN